MTEIPEVPIEDIEVICVALEDYLEMTPQRPCRDQTTWVRLDKVKSWLKKVKKEKE